MGSLYIEYFKEFSLCDIAIYNWEIKIRINSDEK